MSEKTLAESVSEALFEQAVAAHKDGNRELRNSFCFWTQIVDCPGLTRDDIHSYIMGLDRRALKENHKNSEIVAKVLRGFVS